MKIRNLTAASAGVLFVTALCGMAVTPTAFGQGQPETWWVIADGAATGYKFQALSCAADIGTGQFTTRQCVKQQVEIYRDRGHVGVHAVTDGVMETLLSVQAVVITFPDGRGNCQQVTQRCQFTF